MIKKIRKINFKSFNNYVVNDIEFKTINLIYGLNGKGKSSFAQFVQNHINDKDIFECSQENYKIFNYDELYKRNTLYINDDKQDTFSSFYAGDDIVTIIKERNEILEKIAKANLIKQNKEKQRQTNENDKEKLKEDIARNTRGVLYKVNSNEYGTPQSYTKASIKDDDFKNANVLSDDELENCKKYSISEIPDVVNLFNFNELQKLLNGVTTFQKMLKEAPENQAIERFKQDSELENFAKAAINLKNKYPQEYNEKCPLCKQNILQVRLWETLEKHFNQEYQKFVERLNKAKIFFENAEKELNNFENWLNKHLIATKIMLGEKQIDIDNLRQEYLKLIKVVNNDLKELLQKLQQKLNTPNSKDIDFIEEIGFSESLEKILSDELKNIIDSHNKQQANYQSIIDENIAKIKQHFIAKEKDRFLDIQKKITTNDRHIKKIENFIKHYNEEIEEINKKLKEMDKSFEQLNCDLHKMFFEDIRFEKISDSYYKIQRQNFNGEWIDCKSGLSEGEKTIVSVIYFINFYLASLNNLQECPVLIIDDPITSLDSQNKDKIVNYIVQKVKSNQRGQLFILSHDKATLINFNKKLKNQKGEKQILEISKRKLSSELNVLEKIELENDLRVIYSKLKNYIDNENVDTAQNIKELPRQLLEGLFAIIFEDASNFTNCYEKLLKNMGIEEQYSADDIQKLNHNKNAEEKDDEVLNKCKFVVSIFENFIQAHPT